MKVKLLKPAVVAGSVWPAGSVIEVEGADAAALLNDGTAEAVKAGTETATTGNHG